MPNMDNIAIPVTVLDTAAALQLIGEHAQMKAALARVWAVHEHYDDGDRWYDEQALNDALESGHLPNADRCWCKQPESPWFTSASAFAPGNDPHDRG